MADRPREDPARLKAALDALDALHAEDPDSIEDGGERVPAELAYARRMTEALERLVAEPSEPLRIAVRAQHLQRWKLPRSTFAQGRAGYHRWRTEQAKAHGRQAAEVLRGAGYDDETVERVGALIRKERLRRDPEAQAVEDAACLVFVQHHLEEFAIGREPADLRRIVHKTWQKMSEDARRIALELPLPERVRQIVADALAE